MRKLSFVLLGLATCFAACSSHEDPPDPFATVSQFCLAWGQSACTATPVTVCAGADAVTDSLTQACVTSQAAFCGGLLPITGYNSAQAVVCLNAVKAAYSDGRLTASEVDTVRHLGEPCNHLIKGPRAKGESCTTDDDCDTLQNYECIIKGDATTGTCQLPVVVANGNACDAADATCNTGYYCDGNCVQKRNASASCTSDMQCDPALICDPDTSKCIAKVSPKSCMVDSDCTLNNVCDIPLGSASGKCLQTIQLSPSETLCQDLQ